MTPTPDQIAAAHTWFDPLHLQDIRQQRAITADMIEILLAVTAPPPRTPRPADMTELARLVAKELRRRGAWAAYYHPQSVLVSCFSCMWPENEASPAYRAYRLYEERFDNLTPCEIADVIQAEEARKAQEWAGDE